MLTWTSQRSADYQYQFSIVDSGQTFHTDFQQLHYGLMSQYLSFAYFDKSCGTNADKPAAEPPSAFNVADIAGAIVVAEIKAAATKNLMDFICPSKTH